MERALEAMREAELLFGQGHLLGSLNRLYYACFYAVSALLLAKGYSSSKHSGVRSLFHRKLVREGLVSRESAKTYDKLFTRRQRADYEDLFSVEREEVEVLMGDARALVEEI
jgi:uncharacterized protein (UPF0332 family)